MRIAALQPAYLPWLGFFDQMARVDRFVILDDVQFTRRDWRNRNRIRTAQGWCWLTVPVLSKHRFRQTLRETRIDNSVPWARRHLAALRHNYARAPYFDRYFPRLEGAYEREWVFLVDFCLETLDLLKEALAIATPTLLSSELNVAGARAERILNLCRELGARDYLTGDAARDYLVEDRFREAGVRLEYHQYVHPQYRQQQGGFVPYLSVVDLLFNEGPDSLDRLTGRTTLAAQA